MMVNRGIRTRASLRKARPTSRMSQTALLITVIAVLIFSLLNIAIYLAPLPLRENSGMEQGTPGTVDSAPAPSPLKTNGEVSITIQQSPSSEEKEEYS